MLEDNKLIAKLKYQSAVRFPFLSSIISQTPIEFNDSIPSYACTDGKRILLHRGMIKDLALEDLIYLVMHEVLHIALLHPVRYLEYAGKGCAPEWQRCSNILMDARVNALLNQKIKTNIKGLVLPETIGEALEQSGFRFKPGVDEQTKQIYQAIAGDDSSAWERAFSLARSVLDHKEDKKGGFNGNDLNPEKGSTPAQTEQKIKELKQEIHERMVNNLIDAKMRGYKPGGLLDVLEDLYMTKRVQWGKVLKNTLLRGMRRRHDWNFPHKKTIAGGFRFSLPALRRKPDTYHVALALDTSGSMSRDMLKDIAGEILGLTKHYDVSFDLFMCDTRIQDSLYDLKTVNEVDKALKNIRGRGGTSFKPVFKKVQELKRMQRSKRDYKTLIYFSDMFGDQNELKPIKGVQVYWIVPKGGKEDIPFGKRIAI